MILIFDTWILRSRSEEKEWTSSFEFQLPSFGSRSKMRQQKRGIQGAGGHTEKPN